MSLQSNNLYTISYDGFNLDGRATATVHGLLQKPFQSLLWKGFLLTRLTFSIHNHLARVWNTRSTATATTAIFTSKMVHNKDVIIDEYNASIERKTTHCKALINIFTHQNLNKCSYLELIQVINNQCVELKKREILA